MSKLKLGVMFGGVSAEHEVSIITGLQLIKHVDESKYDITAIYVDKSGQWWTGDQIKSLEYFKTANVFSPADLKPFQLSLNPTSIQPIDVAILCFHGTTGESGSVQGLLDVAGIPYQGPSVLSSAISFDKIVTRQILKAEGISQTPYIWFTLEDWASNKAYWLAELAKLGEILFIKPANSGSSIGITRVEKLTEIEAAIELAGQFDHRILVEKSVTDCLEINVSVLADGLATQVSVAEQPLQKDEFLSFADKYQRAGGKKSGMASASRRIPAPISSSTYEKIKATAIQVAKILDFTGVIRIDFFANPSTEEIFLTEPNTIPGSMSFYLWQPSGLPYPLLIDRLVEIALQNQGRKQALVRTFETNLLQTASI